MNENLQLIQFIFKCTVENEFEAKSSSSSVQVEMIIEVEIIDIEQFITVRRKVEEVIGCGISLLFRGGFLAPF